MPIPAKLQEHLDNLAMFPDRQERIDLLIAIGEGYTNFSEEEVPRNLDCKVPGCESEVFLAVEPTGAALSYKFAVDNPQGISAMAMAEILEESLSGAPLDEIKQISEDVIYQIFGQELSMGKSMGLMGMVRMAKYAAEKSPTS